MLGFRKKLFAEAFLVCDSYCKEVVEKSPRRLSRLTENVERRVFRLPKGKKFSGQRLWMLTVPISKVHV